MRRARSASRAFAQSLESRYLLAADPGQLPFTAPLVIATSGSSTLQAENFDLGGQGIAYSDTGATNLGNVYRTDVGVDIEPSGDTDAGFNVGWIRQGEYLEYAINAPQAGAYNVAARVASGNPGGTFHIELNDGVSLGTFNINNTGSWSTWQTLTLNNVALPAGDNTLRIMFDTTKLANGDIGRLNWLQFTRVAPATVSVAATDANAAEAASTNTGTYTISRTGSTASSLLINLAMSGTATNGTDYNSLPGAVTIPAGSASTTLTLTPIADSVAESSETAVLTIQSGTGYAIGTASATVTITNPTLPTINVSATDANAGEATSPNTGTFTITRTGSTTSSLVVNLAMSGAATNGTDYTNIATTVTIPAGSASVTRVITPVNDTAYEGSETAILTLQKSAAYNIGTAAATVTIADNDTLPAVSVSATDADAGEGATANVGIVTVMRTGSTTSALVVNLAMSGTATNGTDYTPIATTVTIPAGSASATVTVTPADDASIEGSETAILMLQSGAGYTLGAVSATVTIADNDVLPTVSVAATDSDAGEGSTPDAGAFTITRMGSTSAPLVVNFAISGTAANGGDYTAIPLTLTIPAGSASAVVAITPTDDALIEGSETAGLTLQASGHYTLGAAASATVTIADNDIVAATQATRISAGDAYVRDGSFAGQNFGGATELFTKNSTTDFNRESLVQFDVSGLTGVLTSAKVRVFGWLQDGSGTNVLTDVYGTSASWSESTINWNNRPGAAGAKLGTATVANTTAQWYEVDVTSFVQTERTAGRDAVALLFTNPAASSPDVAFASREAANKPQLILTLATTPPPPPSGQPPFSGTPAAVPGLIEAEAFDVGDDGIAFHDSDSVNSGGSFRTDVGVDIEPTSDTGGGFNVGCIRAGEWLEYTVDIAAAGTYTFDVRFASGNGGGTAHLEVDGVTAPGAENIVLPGTADWQDWQTISTTNVMLPQGTHVLRLSFDSSAYGDIGNVNWIRLSRTDVPIPPQWPTTFEVGQAAPRHHYEAAAVTVGDKIFVFGGFKNDFQVENAYVLYDAPSATWTTLGTLPAGAAETHQGIVADSRYIYLAGGYAGDLQLELPQPQVVNDQLWRYDTQTNEWLQIGTLPAPRAAGSFAMVGRNLHYSGGFVSDTTPDATDHFVYNLDTGVWSTAASPLFARDHASTVVLGGKIYVMGGEAAHHEFLDQRTEVQVYDPATNTWTEVASMPIAKSHAEASTFVLDGKIVMAGGQVNNYQPTDNVIAYDPAANAWTTLLSLPAPRQGGVVQVIGSQVIVALGATDTFTPENVTWVGLIQI